MTEIKLGKDIGIDLARLLETRLLITANSGAGKSFLIRKFLEESHGKAQQIILDLEGEFATLREKYEYILAGKDGDIQANTKSAELLARKILELGTSIIIDLYELKHQERIRFVKLFLDAMTNAPKELWHPVIVVIDETHIFAPEKGESEAMSAVVDLATRGRKRGFCAVLATQRLSKLHKDVAAECLNKLIGRSSLDIDMKRASEELGFTSKVQTLSLRDLEPGEFYAFGPAISREVKKVKIGDVKTTHPKSGQRYAFEAPAPTEKVKQILSKLTDLPKEAEKELHDKTQMIQRIRELEREIRTRPVQIDDKKIELARQEGYNRAKNETSKEIVSMTSENNKFKQLLQRSVDDMIKALSLVPDKQTPQKQTIWKHTVEANRELPYRQPTEKVNSWSSKPTLSRGNWDKSIPTQRGVEGTPTSESTEIGNAEFGRCERAILKFLAMREGRFFSKTQVGALTNYSANSGGFNNAISKLKQNGLVRMSNGQISINSERINETIEILGDEYSTPEQDSLEEWVNKLPMCTKKIYHLLLENKTDEFTKEELGEQSGYQPTSGGFNNALSQLCTLGLAERNDGKIRFNQELLEV